MFRDRRAKCNDRTVIASPIESFRAAAVGFVGHPGCTVKTRVHVPVAGVEGVENIPHIEVPLVRVECGGICTTVTLLPLPGRRLRQVWVRRQTGRRKEVLRRLSVVIDGKLRVPFHVCLLQVPRFFLRKRERIAIEVKPVVTDAPPDRPGLAMLDGVAIRRPDGDRIVPSHETLVSVGVFAGDDERDVVL